MRTLPKVSYFCAFDIRGLSHFIKFRIFPLCYRVKVFYFAISQLVIPTTWLLGVDEMLWFPRYLLIASLLQVRCRPLYRMSPEGLAVGVIVKRYSLHSHWSLSQLGQRKRVENEECLSIRETKGLTALRAWVLLLTKIYVGNSLNYILS